MPLDPQKLEECLARADVFDPLRGVLVPEEGGTYALQVPGPVPGDAGPVVLARGMTMETGSALVTLALDAIALVDEVERLKGEVGVQVAPDIFVSYRAVAAKEQALRKAQEEALDRLRALLREVEWVDSGRRSMDVGTGLRTVPDLECPVCGGTKPPGGSHDAWYGHEDDCRLAAALAAAP